MKKIRKICFFKLSLLLLLGFASLASAQKISDWKIAPQETPLFQGYLSIRLPDELKLENSSDPRKYQFILWEQVKEVKQTQEVQKQIKVGFKNTLKKIDKNNEKTELEQWLSQTYPKHRHPTLEPFFERGDFRVYKVKLKVVDNIPFGEPFGIVVLDADNYLVDISVFLQADSHEEFSQMKKILQESFKSLKPGTKK